MQLIGVPGEELAAAWYSARLSRLLSGRHDPHVGCDLEIYIYASSYYHYVSFLLAKTAKCVNIIRIIKSYPLIIIYGGLPWKT